jgi:hypothetical protein
MSVEPGLATSEEAMTTKYKLKKSTGTCLRDWVYHWRDQLVQYSQNWVQGYLEMPVNGQNKEITY